MSRQFKQETNGLIQRIETSATGGIYIYVTNEWYLKTLSEKEYFAAEYYRKLMERSQEVYGHEPLLRIFDANDVMVATFRMFSNGMKILR